MRQAIQHQLGQQLDALDTRPLTERVDELTWTDQRLEDSLQQATDDNHELHARVRILETDLTAARTSLRRMIREENTSRRAHTPAPAAAATGQSKRPCYAHSTPSSRSACTCSWVNLSRLARVFDTHTPSLMTTGSVVPSTVICSA